MQELKHFKVERKSDGDNGAVARLLIPNNNSEIEVPGRVLEKTYRLNNGFILAMLTDDSPYEETLHIVLMDTQYQALDQVDIYQAYVGGILSNVTINGSYDLQFDFLEQTFQLNIKSGGEFQASRAFNKSPIHYPNRLQSTYLSVKVHNNQEST